MRRGRQTGAIALAPVTFPPPEGGSCNTHLGRPDEGLQWTMSMVQELHQLFLGSCLLLTLDLAFSYHDMGQRRMERPSSSRVHATDHSFTVMSVYVPAPPPPQRQPGSPPTKPITAARVPPGSPEARGVSAAQRGAGASQGSLGTSEEWRTSPHRRRCGMQ